MSWWKGGQLVRRARGATLSATEQSFRKRPLAWIVSGGTGVALAVAALFGGMEERTDAVVIPEVQPGVEVRSAPWNATVERAFSIASLDGFRLSDTANRWFGVVITITITDSVAHRGFDRVVDASGVEGLLTNDDGTPVAPRVFLRSDGTTLPVLNPGVTDTIVLMWEQEGSAPIPDVATFDVQRLNRRRDSLNHTLQWLPHERTTAARVTVPVRVLEPS